MSRIDAAELTRTRLPSTARRRIAALAGLQLAFSFATTALSQPLEVVIQSGHLAQIGAIAFSPDGCYLATAGADNRVKLWDETSGKEVRSLRAGPSPHTAVAFTPGGESLLIALEAGPVSEWRVSGASVASYASGPTPRMALSRDGRFFVTGGGEFRETRRRITVWNRETGGRLAVLVWNGTEKAEAPHLDDAARALDHDPQAVAISPTGEYVASAGSEGRTALWQIGQRAPVRFYTPGPPTEGQRAPNVVAAFSPNGRYLAGAYRTTAYLWPVGTDGSAIELKGQLSPITALAFSDDGRVVATGNAGGEVWLFDAATGNKLGELRAHPADVLGLAFKPTGDGVRCRSQLGASGGMLSGRVLATSGREQVARIWSLGDSRPIRALAPKVQPLNGIAFSPDGTKLALASSADPVGSAKIWDLTSGYDVSIVDAHEGGAVNVVAFTPEGDVLVTGGADQSTRFWDARTLSPLEQIDGPPKPRRWREILLGVASVYSLKNDRLRELIGNSAISASLTVTKYALDRGPRAFAFDEQGRYMAIGGSAKTVLWDRRENRLVDDWDSTSLISGLAFTADGESLLAVGGLANRSSVETGKEIGRKYTRRYVGSNSATALALLDDTRFALAYDDGLLEIRELDPRRDALQEIRLPNPITSLRLSPDRGTLVVGDAGGVVSVFDHANGRLTVRESLDAHDDTVFAMDFRPDGRVLATASSDGTARLWDTQSWEEIVAFVSIGAEDYVILSPDRHYVASTNGNHGLAFRRNNTLYPFEQFDLALNRPDLVFERLGTVNPELLQGYREAHAKRLQRIGVTSAPDPDGNARLPQVGIEDLPRRAATTERELRFTLVARDAAMPIERLQVWVNDVPLYGSSGLALEQPASVVRRPVRLRLSEGRNKVQAAAYNAAGAESIRATIETIYQPPRGTKPDLYVVAIGVSEYADARYNLAYAAKDASDMIAALSTQRRFASIHAVPILNGEATRERILAVKQLLMNTDVDDEVVVFVAGHGLLDSSSRYFFATADVDFADPARRGVSDEELESLLDGIPSRRKLLLMDTCFSGNIDVDRDPAGSAPAPIDEGLVVMRPVRGVQAAGTAQESSAIDSFRLMERLFANLGRGSGAAVISAAAGDEFAFESTGNGVFTHSILESIADTAADRFLRLSELRSRTVARVRQLTGGRQTPSFRRVNLDFDYPIYSVETPDTGVLPEIDSFEFGKLFIQLSQIENFDE